MAKKTSAPAGKKEYRIVRYLREVRIEVQRVNWPSRSTALRLTAIVMAVTTFMSIALGILDWVFARLFVWLLG